MVRKPLHSVNLKTGIGIDFGTTNSTIASTELHSKGIMVPKAQIYNQRSPHIPSAVYIPLDRPVIVGYEALEEGVQDPSRLYIEFKQSLQLEEKYLRSLPDGTTVETEWLVQLVIDRLLKSLDPDRYNSESSKFVICHPAGHGWASIMRHIMKKRLNIDVETLSEPEACLHYAHHKTHVFNERREIVLLIDFGGGTCDFILMKVEGGVLRKIFLPDIEIIDEDRLDFGGKDLDKILRDEFIKRWLRENPTLEKYRCEFTEPEFDYRLTSNARRIKEKLSKKYRDGDKQASEKITIYPLPGKTELTTVVKISELRDLTLLKILEKFRWLLMENDTQNIHRPLLGRKGIGPDDVTLVILAGGSNRLPWIRETIVPQIFPNLANSKRIILLPDAEMSVAYGAALYATDVGGGYKNRLSKPLPDSVKVIIGHDQVYELAKYGTSLPIDRDSIRDKLFNGTYHTFRFPNTSRLMKITLVAGEGHRASDCRALSFEREVVFDNEIKKDTIMQMQVEANLKYEIFLYISRVSVAGLNEGQVVPLYFNLFEPERYE